MLILTGGEPLMRADCLEIAEYAAGKGITVVLGTNGTMLDRNTVSRIVKSGIKGAGVSLDSSGPVYHDFFRGLPGAWERTDSGIDELREHGVEFNIQVSVTKDNLGDVPQLIEYALKKGARALNVFFLVCTGRGQDMVDITPGQYEELLTYLVKAARDYEGRIMIRAKCAPHFLRIVSKADPESPLLRGATSGCIAGTGYIRITPEGYVTPCPYTPTVAGSIMNTGLKEIWEKAGVFQTLRDKRYNGRCKECEYNEVCGGCRARALSATSDIMGEDPWCEHEAETSLKPASLKLHAVTEIVWTKEAEERLLKAPGFLRNMIKKGVERYAREKGLAEVTPDIMSEIRKRARR